jgi:hypothetical protein
MVGRAAGQNLSIANYQLVSTQANSQTQSYVTYRANLVNSGPALQSATATVSSLDPTNIRVMPSESTLSFTNIAANGQVTSSNTFTLLINSSIPLNTSRLSWTFQSTVATVLANAGLNQTAKVGETVTLNGSASTNPSGSGPLSYSWAFTSRPAGSSTVLHSNDSVMPSFIVDIAGNYTIQLTVSSGANSDSASVIVSTTHTAPVANAGAGQTVAPGATATLNGSGSTDPDGNTLTYAWTLLSRPAGSNAALAGANTITPSFVVDQPGSYTAQLIVTDSFTSSAPSTVVIDSENTPPVANAGSAQVVSVASVVQLNGAGSTDVDGNKLKYQWSLILVPAGSAAALSDPAAVNPTFTADLDGAYIAQLIVNDGIANSSPATVIITTSAVVAPTANPGMGQTVEPNTTVMLNGSGTDALGLPLTYLWSLITEPPGSKAVLSSTTMPNPTFVADLPGNYVAQLVVNNGVLSSVPETVTIATTDTPPVANAGTAQNATVGVNVLLDGSGSSDSDNNPLTYSWSWMSEPTGSTAALVGANSVSPMFTPDVAGVYVAQLMVNDGFLNSAPTTVAITATQPPAISLTPNPLALTNTAGNLTVTIPSPAGTNGQAINLVSGNSSVASVAAIVTIASGATSANVTVTPGTASGSTNVTASASGYSNASATVNVTLPMTVSFTPSTLTINGTAAQNLTLTLSAPAPMGGLTVNLSSSNTAVATVQATATIASGATGVSVPVTGIATGSAAIHASALPNIADTAATVTVQLGIFLPSNMILGPAQQAAFPVTLAAPATSTVFVALSSSDSSKVTVSPATVVIAQGKTTPSATPQVTGVAYGAATITATSGSLTASQQVQVSATLGFSGTSLNITGTATGFLTLALSSPAPAGGIVVNLSSSNTAVATVPATATIAANAKTVSVAVSGVAAGAAVIHASSLPMFPDITESVTDVNPGTIVLPSFAVVGQYHTTTFPLSLGAPAPVGGVTVTLASSDSAYLTIAPATVVIPAGSTSPAAQPQISGITLGYAFVNASAPGYSSASLQIHISDGIRVDIPEGVKVGLGQTISYPVILDSASTGGTTVTLSSSDPTIATISATAFVPKGATTPATQAQLTGVNPGIVTINAAAPGYDTAAPQTVQVIASVAFTPTALTVPGTTTQNLTLTLSGPAPAGGLAINLTSSNTSVATVPATVTFSAGSTTVNVPVTGVKVGTAVIQASSLPNITAVSAGVTIVTSAAISLPSGLNVGLGQAMPFAVTLPSAAPAGGVTIALVSSDLTKLTISPASVFLSAGATAPASQPQIGGVGLGAASITASAPSYLTSNQTIQIVSQVSFAPSTLTIGGTVTQNLTLNLVTPAAAPGLTVMLISSNTGVATVPATVTFATGSSSVSVPVTGVSVGSTTITATTPAFGSAAAGVTVTAGGTIGLPASVSVGLSQTVTYPVTLSVGAPPGGVTVTLSSSDTTKVSVAPLSVFVAGGATTPSTQPQVTGVNLGAATIGASAAGYTAATQQVTTTGSIGFSPSTLTINGTMPQNLTLTLSGPAPAGGLTVNLSSSNTAVATVPATVTFASNATTATVAVTGVAAGTATIHAGALPNLADTTASITVTSGVALVLPSSVTVGPNQTVSYALALAAPAKSTVFVNLSSSDATKLTVSPTSFVIQAGSTMPASTPKVTGVNYGSATITASATGYPTATQQLQVTGTAVFSPAKLNVPGTSTQFLTLVLSSPAPTGGVTFNLSSSNTGVATTPATVTIAANAVSASVAVTGVSLGTAVIHASSLPAIADTTATVTVVTPPAVVLPTFAVVGQNFTTLFPVSLSTPAPAGGVTIALSSSVPSSLSISPASVFVAAGATTPSTTPQISGINLGYANINATATGYASASLQIHISDGIRVNLPSGVSVKAGQSVAFPVILDSPAPVGGVTVVLSSSNTSIATITASVFVAAGATTPATEPVVTGIAAGSAVMNASAQHYTSASPQTVQVTP